MDGARFANALVSLGTTPAEMTWKRGIDLLSFGGTKNGCWCAEALVLFDPSRAQEMHFLRKRSAQLFSKSRFVAAQFDAYLAGDLWLDLARHANAMYVEIQKTAKDDVHWIDLYYSPYLNVSRKNIENFYQNPLGRFFLEDTVKN